MQRRRRVKLRAVVMPSPLGLAMVKLVGPSILKRVVPAAVVAAVLALLGRRLFRRGGKD